MKSKHLHGPIMVKVMFLGYLSFCSLLLVDTAVGQTFQLRDRVYRQQNGRWYIFTVKPGDEVRPERLVVQLHVGITVEDLSLGDRGLGDLEIRAGPIGDNLYVLSVTEERHPFGLAELIRDTPLITEDDFDCSSDRSHSLT